MEQTTTSVQIAVHEQDAPTRALRAVLDGVGDRLGVSHEELFDLKVAATEALTNAIKGSSNGQGVRVEVARRGDSIEIEVTNHGDFELHGRVCSDIEAEGGRGIPLMVALVDEIEFDATRDGTRVRLRKRVRGSFRPRLAAGFS
jgi:serine/threonine-protein kinase RsbW